MPHLFLVGSPSFLEQAPLHAPPDEFPEKPVLEGLQGKGARINGPAVKSQADAGRVAHAQHLM